MNTTGSLYLLVGPGWKLQLCTVDSLIRYDFSPLQTFDCNPQTIDAETIKKICDRYCIMFIVFSVDPFSVSEKHFHVLPNLSLPKALIVCDTHHGTNPIERILRLSLVGRVSTVLLQFNQRHASFFESTGIRVLSSFFSPDLYTFILNGCYLQSGWLDNPVNKSVSVPAHNQEGVFIGRAGRYHEYRRHLLQIFGQSDVPLHIAEAQCPAEMIRLIQDYSWCLNLPLNGDFNRRFIEGMMANKVIVSEPIPSSQFKCYPFAFIRRNIVTFEHPSQIPSILKSSEALNQGLTPLKDILSVFANGYEDVTMARFVESLQTSDSVPLVTPTLDPSDLLFKARAYDRLLTLSLRAHLISDSIKKDNLAEGREVLSDLYDVDDEFSRLALQY